MRKTVKDKVVKVTVLSAVTIITFAGNAAMIIPNSQVSARDNVNISVQELTGSTEYKKFAKENNISRELFEKYSSEGIRPKIERSMRWRLNPEILEYLEISNTEAIEAHQSGKTFKDIAIEKNKSVEEVANIFEDALRYKLDQKFEDGNISYERYINLINNLSSIRDKFLNGVY